MLHCVALVTQNSLNCIRFPLVKNSHYISHKKGFTMRKLIYLFIIIGACPFFVLAQDDVSPVEVFGGYSYLRTGSGYDQDAHGWNTSVAVNISKHFALAGDFAGHYDSSKVGTIEFNSSLHTFMFGPQVNFRSTERVNPFLHALFGVGHDRTTVKVAGNKTRYTDTGFAMALGGGVDIKLSDVVSWRMFQADYLLTRYRDPVALPLAKRNINHLRVSTGLVFH